MSTTIRLVSLIAASSAAMPAFASDAWHPASGEAGFTYHPEHVRSTLTREEFLARWGDERRALAQRGYRWDTLFGTYVFVGPGAPPASQLTRQQFREAEAEQDRQMTSKGMKWNQLFGAWQSAR